jgi:hypothetical protein
VKKNTATKWIVFAFDRTNNVPKTGDAANITADVRIDGGTANAVDDLNPTELAHGYYVFDITAAECNGDLIVIDPVSTTADIQVIGVPGAVWTEKNEAKIDVIDGIVDDILVDTAVIGALGAGLTALATQASVDTIDGNVDAILVDTSTTLDDKLDTLLAQGSGPGAVSVTITVEVNAAPVPGVDVWVTSDQAGLTVVAGTLVTNGIGQVVFMLDYGTLYLWKQKAGVNFINPETIVVS